jgi:AraC family transcriptional regulator, arabinose operon regulatory protein
MDRRIELIITTFKSDPAKQWDTASLAVTVNLSPSRFRHLFKQETGTTPAQYLKELRLRKAAALLRHTFMSIKQVLRQVGLGSNAHFVRDFRKIHGMTPTAYRRTAGRKARSCRRKVRTECGSAGSEPSAIAPEA